MAVLIGCIIGLVLGLTGAGGSVFAVPLLVALLGVSPTSAVGLSLGAVALSSLIGVILKLKSGQIQWLPAMVYAALGSLFTPLGFALNQRMNDKWLMLAFSVLVVMIAVNVWRKAVVSPNESSAVRASFGVTVIAEQPVCSASGKVFKIGLPCVANIAFGAITTGILSGLFGVGGGFIIVPTLVLLTGMTMHQAVATSLFIIATISSTGFVNFLLSDAFINFTTLYQIAFGSFLGMLAGIPLSNKIAGAKLQKLFAVLMLLMAVITVSTTI